MANRADLVRRVASRTGQGRRAARQSVNHTLTAMCELLCEKGRLELRDLGVFVVRRMPPRETVDPRTGEPVVLPAVNTVDFRPASQLKRAINQDQDGMKWEDHNAR